jgi:hypothetical protein
MTENRERLNLTQAALTAIGEIVAEYPANEDVVVRADVMRSIRRIVTECLADVRAEDER